VLFTVLSLFFLGGTTLHDFSLTLLIGLLAGTFSSIFVASPLLTIGGKRASS
jgi:preprotein translocase subunit SecF